MAKYRYLVRYYCAEIMEGEVEADSVKEARGLVLNDIHHDLRHISDPMAVGITAVERLGRVRKRKDSNDLGR